MNSLDKRKLKKELDTQNNRATGDPLFCVYEKIKIISTSENCDGWCWIDDEGDEIGDHDDVIKYASDNLEEFEFKNFSVDCDEDEFESCGLIFRMYNYKILPKFIQPFFTEKAAQHYIDSNSHNLTKPYIYVHSLYRNYEMIDIRNHFMEEE